MSANEGFTPMAILSGIIMMSEWNYTYIYIQVYSMVVPYTFGTKTHFG